MFVSLRLRNKAFPKKCRSGGKVVSAGNIESDLTSPKVEVHISCFENRYIVVRRTDRFIPNKFSNAKGLPKLIFNGFLLLLKNQGQDFFAYSAAN